MATKKKKSYTVLVAVEVKAENIVEAMDLVGDAIEINPKYKWTISSDRVFESWKLQEGVRI